MKTCELCNEEVKEVAFFVYPDGTNKLLCIYCVDKEIKRLT